MGITEKKFLFRSNYLTLQQLELEDFPMKAEVLAFLKKYFSESSFYEVHTSGSTSTPKKIMLHKNAMRNSALSTLEYLQINNGDKILLAISPRHIGGIMVLVRWIEGKLDLYTTEVRAVPELDKLPVVDMVSLVPLQLKNSIPLLSKFKKIIVGGGPVDKITLVNIRDAAADIYHSYGMTETISHIALRKISGPSPDGYFRCLPGVTIRTDERSCLIINAPAIGVEALKTNDIVEMINNKEFIWKGRIDNIINSGGIKLHPEMLEEKIGKLPFPYFLAGVSDEKWGEKLVLIAESKDSISPELLTPYFKNLQSHEKPKLFLNVSRFVYTPTGKLIRNKSLRKALGR